MRAIMATTLFKLSPHRLLVLSSLLLALSSFLDLRCRAQTLVESEVEVLRTIGVKLNKTNWNFHMDPCSGDSGWIEQVSSGGNYFANNVTCGMCNATTNACHVTSIILKGQNLIGELPAEFANLTFLDTL